MGNTLPTRKETVGKKTCQSIGKLEQEHHQQNCCGPSADWTGGMMGGHGGGVRAGLKTCLSRKISGQQAFPHVSRVKSDHDVVLPSISRSQSVGSISSFDRHSLSHLTSFCRCGPRTRAFRTEALSIVEPRFYVETWGLALL